MILSMAVASCPASDLHAPVLPTMTAHQVLGSEDVRCEPWMKSRRVAACYISTQSSQTSVGGASQALRLSTRLVSVLVMGEPQAVDFCGRNIGGCGEVLAALDTVARNCRLFSSLENCFTQQLDNFRISAALSI